MTFIAGQKVKASELNAALPTAIAAASGGNSDLAGDSTTSSTFASTGLAVTATVGPSGMAIVYISVIKRAATTGSGGSFSIDMTGANTVAANPASTFCLIVWDTDVVDAGVMGDAIIFTGLTPGSTTFTCHHAANVNLDTFSTIDALLDVVTF